MTRRKSGHGGARPGAGQPPVAGMPQTERINLTLTEAERAEIEAAVPAGAPVGRWIVESAVMRARFPAIVQHLAAHAGLPLAEWIRSLIDRAAGEHRCEECGDEPRKEGS